MSTRDGHRPPDRSAAWHPLRVGQQTGFVILARPIGDRPACAEPGAYWCGHAGWDTFVGCLEYLDLHTRRPTAATVAVYGTAWDAVRSWHTYLADHHHRHGRAYHAAFEVLPLSFVRDRSTVPRWRQLHPLSTAEAFTLRQQAGPDDRGPGRRHDGLRPAR